MAAVGLVRYFLNLRRKRREFRYERVYKAYRKDGAYAYAEAEDDEAESHAAVETLSASWKSGEFRRTPRYANALVMRDEAHPVDPRQSLSPGRTYFLRLDIGPFDKESHLRDARPTPVPEEVLPRSDFWLDVGVTSADFTVVPAAAEIPSRFLLPADGTGATTPQGRKFLYFELTPVVTDTVATARVSYGYNGTVVQSQKLTAAIGRADGGVALTTDFTLSASMQDLDRIPDRARVTVIANDNGGGLHEVTVRPVPVAGVQGDPHTVRISHETVAPLMERLRKTLSAEGIAPVKLQRKREELMRDLRRIAPLGRDAYNVMAGGWRFIAPGHLGDDKVIIQVILPTGSSFTLPWSFVYDIFLDADMPIEATPFCPVVRDWDDGSDMVSPGTSTCPYEQQPFHEENVLCPFGFWGFRYGLEILTTRESVDIDVPLRGGLRIAIAKTTRGVDHADVALHGARLRELFVQRCPGVEVEETVSKARLRALLANDLPVVYFLCHGDRAPLGQTTVLGIGDRETVSPGDVIGWVDGVWKKESRVIWRNPRPFVFINACHSLEIEPDSILDYVKAFIGRGGAVGVIGTEVKVSQTLAMAFAEEFFRLLIAEGATVERALQTLRLDHLRKGNLFGLLYTPYCFADARLVPSGI